MNENNWHNNYKYKPPMNKEVFVTNGVSLGIGVWFPSVKEWRIGSFLHGNVALTESNIIAWMHFEEILLPRTMYNLDFGDNKLCTCGHTYYRHFDNYEDMNPVGCKYCDCCDFKEKENNG
jgi:hypothetical protein